MTRLTSSMWVSAYVRRCHVEGAYAVVRRRGALEAGAVFVKLDRLDGTGTLFAPAPQALLGQESGERQFEALAAGGDAASLEARLAREMQFDSDLWIIEVEDRQGRHFLDLARQQASWR